MTCQNYLRARGEYGRAGAILAAKVELPPRTRRILADPVLCSVGAGTTSAHAENTVKN